MVRLSLLLAILIQLLYTPSCSGNNMYYLSPEGDDQNPGTIDKPFRTLQHAAEIFQSGDTCILLGGHYTETSFLENLNGTENQPIVIMGQKNQKVVLDGSIIIKGKWSLWKDNIYKTKLSEPIWQLFVDGKSQSSARWPNGNWNDGSIWDKTKSMMWPEKGKGGPGHHFNDALKELDFSLENGGIIVVNSGSFKTYSTFITKHHPGTDEIKYNKDDIEVHFSYVDRIERFGYFLEGKKELIDVPGEWFFEPEDSTLYLCMAHGDDPSLHQIRGKVQDYAIEMKHCSNVVIKNLGFFATTIKALNCAYLTLEDSRFHFPSYSKRMLRDLSPVKVTQIIVTGEYSDAYDTIRNCVFSFMDGPALELNGNGNVVDNCYFHHVDYSCTYKGGYTLNMIDATDLVFRRNTIHTTGASETFKAGRRNLIELNDISKTGYLQNDGSMIQISVKQQDKSITRYNWVHNSVKQGLRFDNSNRPNSAYGTNGSLHHNVAWKTDRIFFKGDHHYIYNNLVFDSHLNDLIISSDTSIQGRNYNTITRNNICNKFSGSRTKPGREYPVPGIADHNWAGDLLTKDIRSQVRDADNLDFRPRKGSDLVDAGAPVDGKKIDFLGKAPDIGPYEYGDTHYWIPGFQTEAASRPVPPDHGQNVRENADLMWLEGYQAKSHRIYFGTDPEKVENANTGSDLYMGEFQNNIFNPGELKPGQDYYWRVDAVTDKNINRGKVWTFNIEDLH